MDRNRIRVYCSATPAECTTMRYETISCVISADSAPESWRASFLPFSLSSSPPRLRLLSSRVASTARISPVGVLSIFRLVSIGQFPFSRFLFRHSLSSVSTFALSPSSRRYPYQPVFFPLNNQRYLYRDQLRSSVSATCGLLEESIGQVV